MTGPSGIRSALPSGGGMHRVGKIRAGIKKSSTRDGKAVSFPSAVDYWVVNADSVTSQESADSFHAVYGDEPRSLRVVLPAERPEQVLEGAWRLYGSGGLLKRKCQGPGLRCTQRDAAGGWVDGPCACDREGLSVDDRNHCVARWTLSVLLMDVTGLGVWAFDTGSEMAARDMARTLEFLYNLRGTLLRAKCNLRLVPRQVAPKGVPKSVYIAQLDAADTTPEQALAMAEGGGPALALPPSPLDEAPDELLEGRVEEIDHVVVEPTPAPVPPPPPPPPPRPAPPAPSEPELLPISEQIKQMQPMRRSELYRLAFVKKGTTAPLVRSQLLEAWEKAGLDAHTPLDVEALLVVLLDQERDRARTPVAKEAFDKLVETGEDVRPGDQTTLDGSSA